MHRSRRSMQSLRAPAGYRNPSHHRLHATDPTALAISRTQPTITNNALWSAMLWLNAIGSAILGSPQTNCLQIVARFCWRHSQPHAVILRILNIHWHFRSSFQNYYCFNVPMKRVACFMTKRERELRFWITSEMWAADVKNERTGAVTTSSTDLSTWRCCPLFAAFLKFAYIMSCNFAVQRPVRR